MIKKIELEELNKELLKDGEYKLEDSSVIFNVKDNKVYLVDFDSKECLLKDINVLNKKEIFNLLRQHHGREYANDIFKSLKSFLLSTLDNTVYYKV